MSQKSFVTPVPSYSYCVIATGIRKLFAPLSGGLLIGLLSAGSVLAASPTGTFQGNAYGVVANAKAGPVAANLSPLAFLSCGCGGTDGRTLSKRVLNISAGNQGKVLTADEVVSTILTKSSSTSKSAKTTSKIEGLNALTGLITATTITAVANTVVTAASMRSTATGSSFSNLQVAGRTFSPTVSPNTRVNLPGIGYVVLNKVTLVQEGATAGSIAVDMIDINVTQNNTFDLPIGSKIVIGHAKSGFVRTSTPVMVAGAAWAAEGNSKLGDVLQSNIGKAAAVSLPCEGTDGETLTNDASTVTAGSILSLAAGHTTAFGGPTANGTTARTLASVDSLRLLNGMITAAKVTAGAQETISKGGTRIRSTKGSRFTALQVLGTDVPNTVPPNTMMTLSGIGYVILNEQKIPPASSNAPTEANGIHVFVTKANVLALPVGSEIIVAHAHVTVRPLRGTSVQAEEAVASAQQ